MKLFCSFLCALSLFFAMYLSMKTGPENAETVNANARRGLNWVAIAALFYWMGVSAQ